MSLANDYLMHYGIPKQRWGVRRFQNKDGSLTEEGRRRYLKHLDSKFSLAKDDIIRKTSNKLLRITRQPVNKDSVKKRGEVSEKEFEKCAFLANEIYDNASAIEPFITRNVVKAVTDAGGNMYGLEHRLKQPTSLAGKIASDAKEKNVDFEMAARSIKDAIRYTSISDDDKFVEQYFNIRNALKELGYNEVRCRNYFDLYKQNKVQHKSVQCVYEDAEGNPFEIQFQTVLSQAAKELKTPLYEERRSRGISESRQKELERQMRDLAEYVPYPDSIFSIQSYG